MPPTTDPRTPSAATAAARPRRRRASLRLLAGGLGAVLVATLLPAVAAVSLASPAQAERGPRHIDYQDWYTAQHYRSGRLDGLRGYHGGLRFAAQPAGTHRYHDPFGYGSRRYDVGRWVSPWHRPGFGLTELIASWKARTPTRTWIRVEVRGHTTGGRRTSWDRLALWSGSDRRFHRTTHGSQSDDLASVAVDTWRTDPGVAVDSWQLRVSLFRETGSTQTPVVWRVGAVASRLPDTDDPDTSRPGVARGVVLDVPRYSQMIHRGEYPQWGGGGEAWCSPTSTSMVLGYYHRLPPRRHYRWVDRDYRQRAIDYAARRTYDYRYGGTGNWPFNTAYAAGYAGQGIVTRLRNLREAERFIKAGIPVVASISFGPGELDHAPIRATNGHLVVIRGFTDNGDVVVNDPAARRTRWVRRVYDRAQFEDAWLPGSGGMAYIIRPNHKKLPRRFHNTNW